MLTNVIVADNQKEEDRAQSCLRGEFHTFFVTSELAQTHAGRLLEFGPNDSCIVTFANRLVGQLLSPQRGVAAVQRDKLGFAGWDNVNQFWGENMEWSLGAWVHFPDKHGKSIRQWSALLNHMGIRGAELA